jgi:hypothetical protein
LGEAVDVLAGALGAAADGDHQHLDAGVVHSIEDPIALAGGSDAPVPLEFAQQGLALELGSAVSPSIRSRIRSRVRRSARADSMDCA